MCLAWILPEKTAVSLYSTTMPCFRGFAASGVLLQLPLLPFVSAISVSHLKPLNASPPVDWVAHLTTDDKARRFHFLNGFEYFSLWATGTAVALEIWKLV